MKYTIVAVGLAVKDAPIPRAVQARGHIVVTPVLVDCTIKYGRFEFPTGTGPRNHPHPKSGGAADRHRAHADGLGTADVERRRRGRPAG